MDIEFVRKRITELRLQKGISERKMSLSLGKAHSYVHGITSGASNPDLKSFLEICDYLQVTPSEFFDTNLDDPKQVKEIYAELKRLCKGDMNFLTQILKPMEPEHLQSLRNYIEKYKESKDVST